MRVSSFTIRSFGKTSMKVSGLGLGTRQITLLSPDDAYRVLNQALDSGINVIDTAECYGRSEEIIGQAISKRREEYYLFTKCGHAAGSGFDLPDWHPHLLEKSIEQSLRRLRTDHLDLIQLHSCSESILRKGEVIEVLRRAQEAGKVRYIGYSGDRHAALYAVQCGAFDALQLSMSIADQECLHTLVPQAKKRQMGIIAKRPIANAIWRSKNQPTDTLQRLYWQRLATLGYPFLQEDPGEALGIALRFSLSVADTAIVGMSRPEHIQQNLALLAAGTLPEELFTAIRGRWQAATRWRKYIPGSRWGWQALV